MLKSQSHPYFTIARISLMRGIQTKIFRVGGEAADHKTNCKYQADFLYSYNPLKALQWKDMKAHIYFIVKRIWLKSFVSCLYCFGIQETQQLITCFDTGLHSSLAVMLPIQ